MHAGVWLGHFSWVSYGSNAAVFVITAIMAAVSGRVLPMFTASGLKAPRTQPLPWLNLSALVSTWLIAVIFVLNSAALLPAAVMSALFASAAFFTAWRLLRNRGWKAWRVPLLWSLHLSVAFIPYGFALFALRYAGFNIPHSAALHALTAGVGYCCVPVPQPINCTISSPSTKNKKSAEPDQRAINNFTS